jgi:hypothetical protein
MAAVCVAGCADGSGLLSSPSGPLAVTTPTVPSSCAVPAAPGNLTATITGAAVSLAWLQVGDATDYVVLVGSTPSSSDTALTNTTEASHTLESVGSGTHFARVHAHNWCGTGEASDPVAFTIS